MCREGVFLLLNKLAVLDSWSYQSHTDDKAVQEPAFSTTVRVVRPDVYSEEAVKEFQILLILL